MAYIAIGLICVLVIVRLLAPKQHSVHAARAHRLPPGVKKSYRFIRAGFIRDEHDRLMDVGSKFLGRATRESMAECGIPDGATFIADYLRSDEERKNLARGAIVVVHGPAKFSTTGYRLRCIDHIASDQVFFFPDKIKDHRPRKLDEVIARVTHVVGFDPGKQQSTQMAIQRS